MQTLFFAEILSASPDYLTLQSRIIQPNGQNLEAASVNYRFSITDPVGTCVVYQEDFSNVSMVDSKGLVAIKIGSGNRGFPVAPTTMKDIFTNFNSPVFNCQAGGTYTAASSDQRKIVMQFNDGSGWQTVPSLEINSTPFSLESLSAQKLGLFPAADYVRSAQFATCVGGEAVHFNGTNFTCVTLGGAASSVAAAAGLAGTPSISFSGDTNTGLYSGAADTISISNNGSNTFNITSTALSSTTTGGATITQTNGTAAAPTFSFAGDADTGWYRAAADTLAASTAGAERIRIDSTGNVGIGTTTPNGLLSVYSSTNHAGVDVQSTWGSASLNLTSFTGNYFNIENAGSVFRILTSGTATYPFQIETAAPTGALYLKSTGNVGIGTTNPTSLFSLHGAAPAIGFTDTVSGATGSISHGAGFNGQPGMNFSIPAGEGASRSFKFRANAQDIMVLTGTNHVLIGDGIGDSANKLVVAGNTSIGYTSSAAPANGLLVQGNVGIGLTAPTGTLHVRGTFKIDDGINSAVTLSNASGLLSLNSAATIAGNLQLNNSFTAAGMAAPLVSAVGNGRIYFDSTANKFKVSEHNGAYVDLVPSASIGGSGTASKIAKFTAAGTIGDSLISDDGSNISVAAPNNLSLIGSNYIAFSGPTYVFGVGVSAYRGIEFHGTGGWPGARIMVNKANTSDSDADMLLYTVNNPNQLFLAGQGANSGNVGIGTTTPQTTLQVAGVISPATNNTYTLGNASYRFTEVYATNGVINTSDRREKKDIYNTDLGLDFINKLRPVSYRWNTGVDKDVHYGLIAQEAEQALVESGKTETTSIVTHDESTDRYGVRYSELISPLIKAVQELFGKFITVESRQSHQEREITMLKAENLTMKAENAALKTYLCSKDKGAPICK